MASYPEHYRNLLHLLRQHRQDLSQGLIPGLRRHARAGEQDAKLELNLPNYVVPKLKKGVRKKESGPYYLYYWQPKRDLRQAGFKSVPLGRDLIDLYQDSEDYRDKAPKTRIGYDRCLELLNRWSARAEHPQVATITRRGLRELHKSLRWPEGESCGHAEGCP